MANFVSVGMWGEWVGSVVAELSGDSILEFGHGPGHLQKQLLTLGKNVIGVDLSPKMGKIARKRLDAQQLPSQLINADGRMLPLASNSIDQIVATFPTEYIYTESALAEILRVLVPAGGLIILSVAWIKPQGVIKRAASILFRITGQAGEWDDKFLGPFAAAGFNVKSVRRELSGSTAIHIIASKPPT